jgi:hypothetical protein
MTAEVVRSGFGIGATQGWVAGFAAPASRNRREAKTAFFADRRAKKPRMVFLSFETDDNDSGGCA